MEGIRLSPILCALIIDVYGSSEVTEARKRKRQRKRKGGALRGREIDLDCFVFPTALSTLDCTKRALQFGEALICSDLPSRGEV